MLGEDIRSDLIDGQQGVPVHLDIQLIDVETCEPIEGTFIEMWSELSFPVFVLTSQVVV